jgi:hypothetical protein
MNSATSWSHDGARLRLQRSLLDLVLSCSASRIDTARAGRFVRFRLAASLNFWATEVALPAVLVLLNCMMLVLMLLAAANE